MHNGNHDLLKGNEGLALTGSASKSAALATAAKMGFDGHEARSPKNAYPGACTAFAVPWNLRQPFWAYECHYFTEKTPRLVILFDY